MCNVLHRLPPPPQRQQQQQQHTSVVFPTPPPIFTVLLPPIRHYHHHHHYLSIVFPPPPSPPPPRSHFYWFSSFFNYTLSTPHWLSIGRTSPPSSTLHRPNIDPTIKRGVGGEILQRVIELIIFHHGSVFLWSNGIFQHLGTFFSQLIVSYFKPTDISCVIKPWLQHIGFSLVYGPLALKTWRYCKNLFINIRFQNSWFFLTIRKLLLVTHKMMVKVFSSICTLASLLMAIQTFAVFKTSPIFQWL